LGSGLEAGIALLLPLLLLIPVSLIGVWWAVRFSLRRVVVFRESLEARGAADLSPVTSDQLPEELEPIAAAINACWSDFGVFWRQRGVLPRTVPTN